MTEQLSLVESDSFQLPVSHGHLEALYERPDRQPNGGALLCHPHPEHGGMMHTKALYHLTRTLNVLGFSTLRFNFRGVGTSTGVYDGGRGEKDDARSALSELKSRIDGGSLLAGGFSFGAAIGLNVGFDDSDVDSLVGIGFPVRLVDFSYLNSEDRPLLVVQGSEDQFGGPDQITSTIDVERSNVHCRIIPGAPHLFTEYFEDLREAVRSFFEEGPGNGLVSGGPEST